MSSTFYKQFHLDALTNPTIAKSSWSICLNKIKVDLECIVNPRVYQLFTDSFGGFVSCPSRHSYSNQDGPYSNYDETRPRQELLFLDMVCKWVMSAPSVKKSHKTKDSFCPPPIFRLASIPHVFIDKACLRVIFMLTHPTNVRVCWLKLKIIAFTSNGQDMLLIQSPMKMEGLIVMALWLVVKF